jgi:hypothetical protein
MLYYPSEELNDFHPTGFSHFADALAPEDDNDIADMEIGSLRTAHHTLSVRYFEVCPVIFPKLKCAMAG